MIAYEPPSLYYRWEIHESGSQCIKQHEYSMECIKCDIKFIYYALFKKIVALGYLIQQKYHNDTRNMLP